MFKSRAEPVVFYFALGLSVIVHLWCLAFWLIVRLPDMQAAKKQSQTNITYFSKSSPIRSEVIQQNKHSTDFQSSPSELKESRSLDQTVEREVKPKVVMMEPDFLTTKAVAMDKTQSRFPEINADKSSSRVALQKISIPMVMSGSVRLENYPEYFNQIGEKIQRKANKMAEGIRKMTGEVRVSFVLRPNGQVMDIRVVEQPGTLLNYDLRKLVTDIVRAASPFEPFSKDMAQQDLPCTAVIEFDLN